MGGNQRGDRFRAHVFREADHRTALAFALYVTVGVATLALELGGTVPLLVLLAAQVVLTALVLVWQFRTLRMPALVSRWLDQKARSSGADRALRCQPLDDSRPRPGAARTVTPPTSGGDNDGGDEPPCR